MTRLSVVIPAYNSATSLPMCLRSLETQALDAPDEYEIVVVDDGSTDGTAAIVHGSTWNTSIRYIHIPRSERSGRSAARNAGIRAATGDIVVMVDADEIVPAGFLAQHARLHRYRDDLVVLGPRHHLLTPPADLDEFARIVDGDAVLSAVVLDTRDEVLDVLSHNLNNLATRWHYMFTCNASVRREHLLCVGGFDEDFTGWGLEDSELGYRLDQHGLAFAYIPEAPIYHQHVQTIDERMHAEWRRNMALFATKHTGPDIAAQWILDAAINPAVDHPTWLECCVRLEFAVRALHGRLPGRTRYERIDVHHGNRDAAVASVARRAEDTNLIVIDHVADAELSAIAQTTATDREILYFRHPDRPVVASTLAMFPATPADDIVEWLTIGSPV